MKLFNDHSTDAQSRAVLAYIPYVLGSGIESSWDHVRCAYQAEPEVHEWFNGRERGFVVHMKSNDHAHQINIAFFEHRNSDIICAVRWEGVTFNPPTMADIPECVYESKGDVSHLVGHGKAYEMATWIAGELAEFWDARFNAKFARGLAEDRLEKLNGLKAEGKLTK